jgi:hypothetical protein
MVAGVVEVKRIERSSLGCKPSALPLSYTPVAGLEGFEPYSGVFGGSVAALAQTYGGSYGCCPRLTP